MNDNPIGLIGTGAALEQLIQTDMAKIKAAARPPKVKTGRREMRQLAASSEVKLYNRPKLGKDGKEVAGESLPIERAERKRPAGM